MVTQFVRAKLNLYLLFCLLIATFVCVLSFQTSRSNAAGQGPEEKLSLETSYDSNKDTTTVRLPPVKISGEKAQYHSLHMSPSFSYPGKTPVRPSFVDFELQTVVKGRLRTDLYVVFVIDGETVFLSSNRWAVKRPIPGRVWMGERLVFRMPIEILNKLAEAKSVRIRMDGVGFILEEAHRKAISEFAAAIKAVH